MNNSEKILEKYGWIVECELPLEIRHNETGSFASGVAAEIVIDYIIEFGFKKGVKNE